MATIRKPRLTAKVLAGLERALDFQAQDILARSDDQDPMYDKKDCDEQDAAMKWLRAMKAYTRQHGSEFTFGEWEGGTAGENVGHTTVRPSLAIYLDGTEVAGLRADHPDYYLYIYQDAGHARQFCLNSRKRSTAIKESVKLLRKELAK